jgi:Flp pilus assembly protein TadG
MASRLQRLWRREDGQALVELSLCAGFLCLMLLAVWQVGTVFSNYIDMSEAARAAARAAALDGAPTTAGDQPSYTLAKSDGAFAAQQSVPELQATGNLGITITAITPAGALDSGGATWMAGSRVRATVTYPYRLTLFGVSVTSGTLTLSDDMRVHRQGA